MSPEQASGVVKNLGPRADVYSVGAVLYELVTGRPPFTSPEPLQTILMVLSQPPVAPRSLLPRLSPDLENIILKCLEKSPHHRYVSCEALAADLHRYMQGEPVQARPVPWQRQLSFWLKRHPALATAMALSAVLILSVIVGTSFYNAHLQQELERTQRMVDNSRQFSRWLLYDFSAALEGDQGLTRLRKQLAQKSEEHLNRMQTEVADDHALRLAIADAQLRLSQVHVALGDWSAARKNLQQALATIPQEGGAGSPQERQIAILATIRLAKLDLEDGEMVRGAERLTDARAWMNEIQALVSPDQYQEMFAEWSLVQVDLAGRQGDLQKLESLLAALLESRPQSQASDLTVAEEVDWLLTTWVAKGTLLLRLGQTEPILTDLLPRLAAIKERLSQTSPALGVRAQVASLERFLADALFQRQEFSTALSLYRQQRALWMEVVERDPENLEALHNLALAWQHEAECLMFLDQLPEAREALREALATLERHQTLSGRDWQTDPDSLGYWGTLAYWHWLHGDTNEVIRLRQRVVRQLQPLAKQNVLWQQMLGESLLFIGLAKAQIYTEKMADAVQGDLAELKQAFRDAQAALKQASDYFQDLQQRGVLSPQGAGQKDRAEEMQAFLTESHHKLMATFGEIH
jgi:tetratricopeptide (TPR) repeat protein